MTEVSAGDRHTGPVFGGSVREAIHEDAIDLRPVLHAWVRDSITGEIITEEVEEILESVRQSAEGTGVKRYIVALSEDGKAIGMAGLQDPTPAMAEYAETSAPAELINLFVAADQRGLGVGKALLDQLELLACANSYTEIIFNSGPRYKGTGWGFHTHRYGSPKGIVRDYYGPGLDAPVWAKTL